MKTPCPLRVAPFRADITPSIGSPLCAGWYPAATAIEDPLSANGVVLVPEGQQPIVLCALDWAELSNAEYDLWRDTLAAAAGTVRQRVAVHCTHCHDAPWPDRGAQGILEVLRRQGLAPSNCCLNPQETLSPGQAEELDRVTRAYPHLIDDDFVAANLDRWLS